jgi:DNA/RNA-binding domain of Phe-tRNA-synthetase-like protein
VRTRLTEASVNALFLLEGMGPAAGGQASAAAAELAESLEKLSPGARIRVGDPC